MDMNKTFLILFYFHWKWIFLSHNTSRPQFFSPTFQDLPKPIKSPFCSEESQPSRNDNQTRKKQDTVRPGKFSKYIFWWAHKFRNVEYKIYVWLKKIMFITCNSMTKFCFSLQAAKEALFWKEGNIFLKDCNIRLQVFFFFK